MVETIDRARQIGLIEAAMRRRIRTPECGEALAGAMRSADNLYAICPGCRRERVGTWEQVVEAPCSCGWQGQGERK